jgi:phosphoribosylaminoimidazole-succinocarboxamide synthase
MGRATAWRCLPTKIATVDDYEASRGQKSSDKQFLRDWLETSDWDKESEPPQLTEDIVADTRTPYIES